MIIGSTAAGAVMSQIFFVGARKSIAVLKSPKCQHKLQC